MLESWRWFGPGDPIMLDQIVQTGARGIVTALHQHPAGVAWPLDDILAHKQAIKAAGLTWAVVESIWMPDSIKSRTGPVAQHLDAFKASLRACAQAGLRTICYNFMPVVDWTRTDLMWRTAQGGYALRFDRIDFIAYDVFELKRPGAARDYAEPQLALAQARHRGLSESDRARLERNIIAGLPGGSGTHDRAGFLRTLAGYGDLGAAGLQDHLLRFLAEMVPLAEELGLRLCVHPDDPPFPLFGLPRVVSTADDLRALFAAQPGGANGLTFCVGSLGVRADNDLPAMLAEFGPRIHFAHLRNVTREPDGSFHEAAHLDGSSDMVAVVAGLLREERRRRAEGRADDVIPMRPDHGHLLLDDIRKSGVNPGYSAIGRLKGLAELRGVSRALEAVWD